MTALKKDELEKLERQYKLEPDGLTYQQRCSRMAAKQKGEEWEPPQKKAKRKLPYSTDPKDNPLFGKKILISPLMTPDAKRHLAFDEEIGHEITTRDFNAGEHIYGANEEVQRMVGDYEVVHEDRSKPLYAKTTFPKIGTEISWTIGKQIVPVVRGNDGATGYIWSFPTCLLPVEYEGEEYLLQAFGLKAIIQTVYPDLLQRFSGKPIMSYIDGVTLAASIPLTDALLKEKRRQELIDARAGIV